MGSWRLLTIDGSSMSNIDRKNDTYKILLKRFSWKHMKKKKKKQRRENHRRQVYVVVNGWRLKPYFCIAKLI